MTIVIVSSKFPPTGASVLIDGEHIGPMRLLRRRILGHNVSIVDPTDGPELCGECGDPLPPLSTRCTGFCAFEAKRGSLWRS